MNLKYFSIALVVIPILVIAEDFSEINSDSIDSKVNDNNKDESNSNSMPKPVAKRVEEVPNYGFLNDDVEEEADGSVLLDGEGKPWIEDKFKRSRFLPSKPMSDTMKTCMLYVNQLLNLICDTDDWMATSHYRNADKKKIKMRCCLSPCSLSSLKMHCKRRTESEAKQHLRPMAMLLRPDVTEKLPNSPNENNEIEKVTYSMTPNGFFGAFYP